MKGSARRPMIASGLAVFAGAVAFFFAVGGTTAQDALTFEDGLLAEVDEALAWEAARGGRFIKARELSESILRERSDSYVGHFVLGVVHQRGEANFARALYHLNRSRTLLEDEYGEEPPLTVWRWHARILRALIETHGHLEHYQVQLDSMNHYNELYEPDYVASQAWPYMKLRQFDNARQAAELGIATGRDGEIQVALNALCAVEFEAGDDQASYEACERAMNLYGGDPSVQSVVDFTNFAEAARGVFRLDEAERVGRLATEARVTYYGNPWVDLAELYVREARFVEGLDALERVPRYRQARPPHVRNADRNESRRALASFFLCIGRDEDAITTSTKALTAPDRRAHTSRDPHQDRAILALLHRAALRLRAERRMEEAAGLPWHRAVFRWGEAQTDRFSAWLSGRVVQRNLADEERLVGTFMIGTHRSAVMPPWLVGELTDVLGAGVVDVAIQRARAEDDREGSDAYYDAFEAEAALGRGDEERARELVVRSLAALSPAEAMLRSRLMAIHAESARRAGNRAAATEAYGGAFQGDPGVFRRLGWAIPARFASSGPLGEDLADVLSGGPRFEEEDWGMRVVVSCDTTLCHACLNDSAGTEYACSNTRASGDDADEDAFIGRAAADFIAAAFAPRVDLSQADANSLDASNQVTRDPLRNMFGHEPPPRAE